MELKNSSIIKPSNNTRFHIDFAWWEKNDRDWRVFLQSYLCPEHQQLFQEHKPDMLLDYIDPVSAEVKQVDGLQHVLISHCARQPEFISDRTAVVDAVFRIFLANGNQPKSCLELSERLGKPAETLLRVISGSRVYKGLRPFID